MAKSLMLDLREIEALLVGQGMPRNEAPTLAAIAYFVESGGNPQATCWDYTDPQTGRTACYPNWDKTAPPPVQYTSVDKGLFQINSSNYAFLEAHGIKDPAQSLYNPIVAAKAAVLLWSASGFGPWQGDLSSIPAQYEPGKSSFTGTPIKAKLTSFLGNCPNGWVPGLFGCVPNPGPKIVPGLGSILSGLKGVVFTGLLVLGGIGIAALGFEQLSKGPDNTGGGTVAKAAALGA